jgi:regulator of protease activity HflC (stomatin/prohibitin superfamily)
MDQFSMEANMSRDDYDNGSNRGMFTTIVVGATAALALLTGYQSVTRVKPTEKAVQVTFQNVKGILGPGWHFTPPFVTSAYHVPMTLNIAKIEALDLRTKDQQNYKLNFTIHYCLTDGCTDPKKLAEVRNEDVLRLYQIFEGRSHEDIVKTYVTQAANVIAGQEGLLNVAKDLTKLRQDIIAHTRKSIEEAGFSSFLRLQDIVVSRFKMEPEAERFANKIANEGQNTTLLGLQSDNAKIKVTVAEREAQAVAATTSGSAKGIAEGIKFIMDTTGASADAAVSAMNTQAALQKWDGHSLNAPVGGAPVGSSVIVDIGKAGRPPDRKAPAARDDARPN